MINRKIQRPYIHFFLVVAAQLNRNEMTVSRCFVRARKRQQRAKAAWENLNSSILSLAERAVTAEDKTATCTETEALMRAAASSVLAQQEERLKVEDKLSEAEVSIFLAVGGTGFY